MVTESRPPTIHTVAERAGVSKSLVSLVLRGSPNVSEQRRRDVLCAIDELGYRPNAVARSLVTQRTSVVGVLVSDLQNPFFADVVSGLQERARQSSYRVIVGTGDRDAAATFSFAALPEDATTHIGRTVTLVGLDGGAAIVP